ncbi:hypoxanthine/guanine phosphoribosyltransferase [Halalkalicoccus paucihalophilus]|uniref:Hypoxanthine/guanine phosphoribosyltransferase n=1 Tax=Halalkalicoccus paucihalophilus TaxID=1008153 RepID=A0A151AGR9_9EURY|nr:hypoxanthine/guanine phosphoribosyltransferase [Halalkalicoccus paucihalophilus]KYH26869.1 hypoxanthine/guanine phosphoribosyltransferase [Halalkalicoccus paucihalophilus]
MDRLVRSLESAPVVSRDGYDYFVHPVTDAIPAVEAPLLREIAEGIARVADLEGVDRILTAESMGIHHATALTLETEIPFSVARKRSYGFETEVAVHQETGYSEGELYVNGIEAGDRVLLVDDVCSTGGTLRALCGALVELGAEPTEVVVVIRRVGDPVDLPVSLTSLVEVEIRNGAVVVNETP